MKTTSPGKQKALGRCIERFDEQKWDEVKSAVVERGNLLKFTQCTNLADMKVDDDLEAETVPLQNLLLATGEHELVEASHFDRVWGIGFNAAAAMSVDRASWGQNLLGKALMRVREEIRKG